MTSASDASLLRRSIISADPELSRFQPLETILIYDNFDTGLRGWTELIGNYEDSIDNAAKPFNERGATVLEISDARPPMLSSATMHDTGSAGALSGTYSMKIASRPIEGHLAKSLKRMTFRERSLLQCEAYFTFHPEASTLKWGERDVRAFGVSYDLQDDETRYWPAIRYLNAENGEPVEKWQFHAGGTELPHLDGWEDLDDGVQQLCYNEIPTKQNWHYLRWTIDLETREYIDLQCNDRVWDLRGKAHSPRPPYPKLRTLMNLGFWVETDTDRRAFLYVDSVVLSAGRKSNA